MLKELFTKQEAIEVYEFASGQREYYGKDGLSDKAQFKLYCAWQSEMPYGVQKARTGDPDQWMGNKFSDMGEEETVLWIDSRTEGGFNLQDLIP